MFLFSLFNRHQGFCQEVLLLTSSLMTGSIDGFLRSILILFFGITPSFQLDGDQELFEFGLPLHEL